MPFPWRGDCFIHHVVVVVVNVGLRRCLLVEPSLSTWQVFGFELEMCRPPKLTSNRESLNWKPRDLIALRRVIKVLCVYSVKYELVLYYAVRFNRYLAHYQYILKGPGLDVQVLQETTNQQIIFLTFHWHDRRTSLWLHYMRVTLLKSVGDFLWRLQVPVKSRHFNWDPLLSNTLSLTVVHTGCACPTPTLSG